VVCDHSPQTDSCETIMALQLRPNCEYCDKDLPPTATEGRICSYECTFCGECTAALDAVCPNCGGELVRRPKPKSAAAQAPNNSLESESISARRSVAS
jgi:hypothetical protein